MKRFIITLLLICALCLALAACEQKDPNGQPGNQQEKQEQQQQEEGNKENDPPVVGWPTVAIGSYCGSDSVLPAYTGHCEGLSYYTDSGNLCIDLRDATHADYVNYTNVLLNAGYTLQSLPTYEKSFTGFKISVSVSFNEDHKELYLTVSKQDVLAGWPAAKIIEAIGEEAARALPAFEGAYDYDFTTNEWSGASVTVTGTGILQTYTAYVNDLKNTYLVFEDFNDDDYKEYRYEYTLSNFDTASFDLIYDGSDNSVRISLSYEAYEAPVAVLPDTYHLSFKLQNNKVLDVYRSGNDYAFINTSSSTKKVEYYKMNSDRTYMRYTGEGNDLSTIVLSEPTKIVFREFLSALKDNLYDRQTQDGLRRETDPDRALTVASIPCDAHAWQSYVYHIDPVTHLLCKASTDDYLFRELTLFENTCNFPFTLPQ